MGEFGVGLQKTFHIQNMIRISTYKGAYRGVETHTTGKAIYNIHHIWIHIKQMYNIYIYILMGLTYLSTVDIYTSMYICTVRYVCVVLME